MCSACPPPSLLPGPNWGGLTSWPELNWVVLPVASVSFPVSQGGLHSHCVRHCIVLAGCNQADESRISRNTLRGCLNVCELLTPITHHTKAYRHKYVGIFVEKEHKTYPLFIHLCVLTHTHTHPHARPHTHTHTPESIVSHGQIFFSSIWVFWISAFRSFSRLFSSVFVLFYFIFLLVFFFLHIR